MKASGPLPEFAMRHRMALALEYASVSVTDIAKHLDISRTTVSNYLHGRTQPSRNHLANWALRCGVPLDWLVDGTVSATPAAKPKGKKKNPAS